MASRRRLDISSLLCNNEEDAVNGQLSRSAALSPTQQQQQQQQQTQPAEARVRSYGSSERSALALTSNPYNNAQDEQSQQQLSPTYQESSRSQPSVTALTPLAHQPSPTRRQTPSPPFAPQSASPVDGSARRRRARRSEDLQGSGFPRSEGYTTQTQAHLHLHTQYLPPPSSTSPVNVHAISRGRRASTQVQLHHSPTSQTHSSPSSSSLPSRFPSLSHPLSISPSFLPHSTQPSTSSSSEGYTHRSPVLPRLPEARMLPTQRASASLSPIVPTSGLSGLDVLVQAATEERERIDVHRRQSGGEEPHFPFGHTTAIRAALSPVEFQSDTMLQAPPPTPPYTASSETSGYLPVDHPDAYYKGQAFGEDERAVKRRRSSPESSHLLQIDVSQDSQYSPHTALPLSDNALTRRSLSPGAAYDKYEHRSHGLNTVPRLPSASSGHTSVSNPDPLYTPSSSASTSAHHTAYEEVDRALMNTPPRYMLPLSPVEPVSAAQTRRSPPRSKPRPKKPGSAALAVMEKEFRGVALSDRDRRGIADSRAVSTARNNAPTSSSSRSQTRTKLPGMSSRSLQSNERGAADDEDVDDFFLSTFDSPRNAERQIPSQNSSSIVTASAEIEENDHSAARWSNGFPSLITPMRSATSATKLTSPTLEAMNELSDQFAPVRRTHDRDVEGIMSEVEAEILGELADAAGAATSEDERTEFDDQETDTMEVDVEDELLSLIDGPFEHRSKPRQHSGLPTSYAQRASASPQHADFINGISMPPPDALRVTSAQARDSKKGSAKPRVRRKADDTAESGRVSSVQIGDLAAKSSKSKSSSKPRPAKGASSDKAKMSKELSTPVSSSLPTLPMPLPNSSVRTGEAFPMVTSSGRMVTKSKKSAAAAAAVSSAPTSQPSSSQNRKKPTASGGGDGTMSRSRSHSVMPRVSVDPEVHREKFAKVEEEKPKENVVEETEGGDEDKLYCICRTKYDEDRVMICCDRCDEWYHTQCVNMPDLLIDLVDQFICPNCIARNPSLHFQTTYKQRCLSGLNHPCPESTDACHKASRGAYSKYCSDECGVRYMHFKIQAWASNGGDVRGLWESVKDAKRREGFVTREPGWTLPKAIFAEIQNGTAPKLQGNFIEAKQSVADEEGRESIVARLEKQLQIVVRNREEHKKELEVISWRERLLQLASDRAEAVGDCGWDQRLVYGDEEWLEFGAGVLESYEDTVPNGHSDESQEMEVDGQSLVGEWWCQGKKKCERHMGWQRVRSADIEKERVMKERALADLTTREREIRSRIEDVLHPQSRSAGSFPEATFTFKLANVSSEGGVKRAKKKSVAAV